VRLNQLIDQADATALRFPPFEPAWPLAPAARAVDLRAPAQGDVLLHHPFESFEPVVQFLREAVTTPTCWPSSRPSTAPAASRC
jgi:polyphosphate kinase